MVKDACRRNLGRDIVVTGQKMKWDMVPYDVQLIGGIALHQGKVAEMATGEGKTLVATMPLYLNALAGRGAHLVTVNSYLAQRDAEWMGVIYDFLGLDVDVIDLHEPGTPERRAAYNADITYGTNNEFGFDYLRDNMVHSLEQRVQRRHHYAIIDEVDSILIDEARTPLIISGPVGKDSSAPFKQYSAMVANLYRKQTRIANELVAEAEKLLERGEDGDEYAAGEKLLSVKRGTPRHKKLMKMFADEPRLQKLVQKVEADYMREKILHQIDENLLFAMDEKGHNVHLSDAGIEELSARGSRRLRDPRSFRSHRRDREERRAVPGREAVRHSGAGGAVRRQEPEDARDPPAPEGLHPLPQGRAVHHRRGRLRDHRGRVHGPADGRTALERRTPSGRGGEGRRGSPGGDPDPGHHHHPELLPHVRQAVGDDRYGGDGGE